MDWYGALMPVYIEKSGDLVGCYHSGTNEQTRKDRATQPLDYGRLRWANSILFLGAKCIEYIIRDRSQYKAQIHHSESQYDYKASSLATSKEGIYIMLTLWQLWDILIQEMLNKILIQIFDLNSHFHEWWWWWWCLLHLLHTKGMKVFPLPSFTVHSLFRCLHQNVISPQYMSSEIAHIDKNVYSAQAKFSG